MAARAFSPYREEDGVRPKTFPQKQPHSTAPGPEALTESYKTIKAENTNSQKVLQKATDKTLPEFPTRFKTSA